MFNINSSVLEKSGFTAEELEEVCREKFAGLGSTFFNVETETGINALYMIAHGAIESAWGTSNIAETKNNLFGWNADDNDPDGDASNFSSYEACIAAWSSWLKGSYLTPGGSHYNGPTLHDIFVDYSSSHDTEAQSVATLMNELEAALGQPQPDPEATPPAPTEPTIPSQHLYVIGSGDTFDGVILKKFPGTTIAEWIATNNAKYPNITADHIEAGWTLVVPEESGTQTTPTTDTNVEDYEVVVGDTLLGLASKFDTTTGQLIGWNQAKYPRIGSGANDLIEAGWVIRVR